MIKKNSYKIKYQLAKAHEDLLIEEVAKLKAEITELRWENESLKLEIKKVNTIRDRLFEAGCIIAKELEDLKAEVQKG